jgi:phytoene dehydrogenase-like protein
MSVIAIPEENYDAVIIGGGIGGLVAAAYLARAKARVALFETQPVLGGAAETADIGKGYRAPIAAHTLYAFDGDAAQELQLARHGLRFAERDMNLVALRPGGRHLVLPRNLCRGRAAIHSFAASESWAYARWKWELLQLARRLRPWWTSEVSPDGAATPSVAALAHRLRLDEASAAKLDAFSRMSAAAYLDRWFESDALKTALSFDVALDGLSPQDPGSALLLLWRHAQSSAGRRAAVSQPLGGPLGLVQALERAARDAGAEVRTEATVASVLVEQGRAAGVRLHSGGIVRARVLLSSLDVRQTLLGLVPAVSLGFGAALSVPSSRTLAPAKLLLALSGVPPFAGLAARDLRGRLILAERPESAAEAKAAALEGRLPETPIMEVTVPTVADPELAPAGGHVLSVLLPDMPIALEGGWRLGRNTLRRRVLTILEAYAPGLKDRIVSELLLTPDEAAPRNGAVPAVARLLSSYGDRIRTPLPGLLLCGSTAEPVDAISGRAGRIAALFAYVELQKGAHA